MHAILLEDIISHMSADSRPGSQGFEPKRYGSFKETRKIREQQRLFWVALSCVVGQADTAVQFQRQAPDSGETFEQQFRSVELNGLLDEYVHGGAGLLLRNAANILYEGNRGLPDDILPSTAVTVKETESDEGGLMGFSCGLMGAGGSLSVWAIPTEKVDKILSDKARVRGVFDFPALWRPEEPVILTVTTEQDLPEDLTGIQKDDWKSRPELRVINQFVLTTGEAARSYWTGLTMSVVTERNMFSSKQDPQTTQAVLEQVIPSAIREKGQIPTIIKGTVRRAVDAMAMNSAATQIMQSTPHFHETDSTFLDLERQIHELC